MSMGPCFDDAFLARLAQGHLSDEENEHAFSHIDTCTHCQQRFESIPLEANDLLVNVRTPKFEPSENPSAFKLDASRDDCLEWLGSRRIIKKLDAGGMGTVYLCKHQKLDRYEAVKLFPEEWKVRPLLRARFSREAKAFAKLDHPNVVRAWDADEIDGRPYIAMEYLPGLSVAKLIRRHTTLPIGIACEITRQAALGLSYVHQNQLVHRDIKPGNLVVLSSGIVKLVDFGLVLDHGDQLEALTQGNERLGTAGYTAPEQLRDSHTADYRADVFALAASFVAMVSGSPPLGQLCLPEDTPVELIQLLQKMLKADRNLRIADCAVIAQTLQKWCDPEALERLAKGESGSSEFKPLKDFSHFVSSTNTHIPLSGAPQGQSENLSMWSIAPFGIFVLLAVWLYYDPSRSLILSWLSDDHTKKIEQLATSKNTADTAPADYQGRNLQAWFKLLSDAQTPQELRTAIEAIVILAHTTEEQQQATQHLVMSLKRIPPPPDPRLSIAQSNSTLSNNSMLEDLRNGLFLMPSDLVVSTLLTELQFGTVMSQSLAAGMLRDALHGRRQLQQTIRIRRNEISDVCLNVAQYSSTNTDALQLYVQICEIDGINPTANVRAYDLLKKRALNFSDPKARRLSDSSVLAWELLMKYAPETPELESSLVAATCFNGPQVPIWERQLACRILMKLERLSPESLQQLSLHVKNLSQRNGEGKVSLNNPRGDSVFVIEVLRLLRKHHPDKPLPFELDSLEEELSKPLAPPTIPKTAPAPFTVTSVIHAHE